MRKVEPAQHSVASQLRRRVSWTEIRFTKRVRNGSNAPGVYCVDWRADGLRAVLLSVFYSRSDGDRLDTTH